MKYLKILTSISFFLAISISGYGQGQCPHWTDEGGIGWGPCADEGDPDGGGNSGGAGTGDDGSDPNPPTTIYCSTNHNILSETVIPCGSGFAVITTWQASCTSGNAGSCQVGTYTEFSGCFDGELPEEETNLSTQYCN